MRWTINEIVVQLPGRYVAALFTACPADELLGLTLFAIDNTELNGLFQHVETL